jgi:UDP-apiose/xylose synthase
MVDRLLRSRSHSVVGIDITDEKLADVDTEGLEYHQVDIQADGKLVDEIVGRSDVVVDLIAFANPSIYVDSPAEVFELNFVQNLKVVDACRAHGTRIIQYSTSEIYGRPTSALYSEDESELIMGPISKQRWIYASSKQLLERVLHAYGLDGQLEYTIVRPFNFIGPRLDYLVPAGSTGGPRVFAHFMSALLTGGPMYLVDGGHAHRSFTNIEDATDAFMILLEHPGARNEIFNVGNPRIDISIRGLAELMKEIYQELTGEPSKCQLTEISGEDFYGPGYQDTNRVPPDISKLRALGYEPRFDLRTTLTQTMRHYLEGDFGHILQGADAGS